MLGTLELYAPGIIRINSKRFATNALEKFVKRTT